MTFSGISNRIIGFLFLGLVSCGEHVGSTDNTHVAKDNPQYNQALAKTAKIDSLNASLEWEEIVPGIWQSNQGDYGFQESRMIYLDSMLFVTDYITKIDSTPINQIINRPTFEHLGNSYYKDAYHIYYYYPMAYGGSFNILDTADRESFQVVGDCYAQDIHFVYSEKGEILEEIDHNTFFTTLGAGCFAKDKNGYYLQGELIEHFEMDSVYMSYIHLLDEATNRIDTLYSDKPEWELNPDLGPMTIHFSTFDLQLNSTFEINKIDKDTIVIYEDVGEYLSGRALTIHPKNESDTFHLYIQSVDHIYEMMDSDSLGVLGDWFAWDPLEITDTSQFFYWKPKKENTYIFPNIGYEKAHLMQERAKDFGFSDTTYWYHGEMSGTYYGHAWLYKGHIVSYWIYTAFVKIERHNNGLKETKWLRLEFSYGC